MTNDNYTINCEYCGAEFSDRYYAQRDKADHKRKCSKKRYLGGELTIETAADQRTLLEDLG